MVKYSKIEEYNSDSALGYVVFSEINLDITIKHVYFCKKN